MTQSLGVPASPSGHSRAEPEEVSALRASVPNAAQSLFGDALDALCRERGGWPKDAIPYAVEVIGQGDDPQVLLTGEVPVGVKRDGSPKFGTKQRKYKSAVLLSEYRAAFAKAEESA